MRRIIARSRIDDHNVVGQIGDSADDAANSVGFIEGDNEYRQSVVHGNFQCERTKLADQVQRSRDKPRLFCADALHRLYE